MKKIISYSLGYNTRKKENTFVFVWYNTEAFPAEFKTGSYIARKKKKKKDWRLNH